jgi:hypothetical protein
MRNEQRTSIEIKLNGNQHAPNFSVHVPLLWIQ